MTHSIWTWTYTSPIELGWLSISILFVMITMYGLREALIDSAVLTANKVNGPRRVTADANVRQEEIRIIIAFIMLLSSIGAIFLPPPPPEYSELPQSLILMFAWILVAILLTVSSFFDRSIRLKLEKYSPIEVQTSSQSVPAKEGATGKPEEIIQAVKEVKDKHRSGSF